MDVKYTRNFLGLLVCGLLIASHSFAEVVTDPCGGPTALLAIVNRPTVSDSACVVPYKNAVMEFGYQHQKLIEGGNQQNFPEAVLRFGLPTNNELVLLLPNYIHQSVSGFGPGTIGIKHELGYNAHWLGSVEALFTLPTGSRAFGSDGLGEAANAIVIYTFNPQFSFTFMIGATSQTTSSDAGGQRFSSMNPDAVFTWNAQEKLSFYAEVYGQSKAGPDLGSGFNMDAGALYLLTKNLAVDLEFGHRISGQLGGFDHYIGAGFSIMLP
jgi:Putative MetA-pathway of phenol degradation